VVERSTKQGCTFGLRFRAYGQREYVTLGTSAEGWTRPRAEVELANVLADVRRGTWRPPIAAVVEPPRDPTFHEFASEWFERKRGELRPNTVLAYGHELTDHLLPFFARHRLSQITVAEVDRYRQAKVREGRLGATTINKTITRLAQVLEDAVEYDLIDRNPALGRRRRLKAPRPHRVWLDRAEQITALLDAAGQLDRDARADRRALGRRALLSTLAFGGLRIGEALDLRWRDVDLAGGRLRVRQAKTDAGVRLVDLLPALLDELATFKACAEYAASSDLVFVTRTGRAHTKDNVRNRVLLPAVTAANTALEAEGLSPLPEGLTLHSLRHTACSLRLAIGDEPPYVMAQLGHVDSAMTMGVYAHVMFREADERNRLRALVEGVHWAPMGTGALPEDSTSGTHEDGGDAETSPERGFPVARPAGFEPATSRSGGERSIH